MSTEEQYKVALTSPALEWKSDRKGDAHYPWSWRGKTPLKVKMAKTVMPDVFGMAPEGTIALMNGEYYVWVNSYGAVSAILKNGQKLGLKPFEFEITMWHEDVKK